MNKAQIEYMTRNGLADMAAVHAALPAVRLGFANLAGQPDPVEETPTTKITGAAQDFLGDRDPASLSKSDFELFHWLNTNEAFRKPAAAAASAADLAQSIEPPKSRAIPALDPAKLAGLSGPAKNDVANAFAMLMAVRSGRFTTDEDKIMVRLAPYLQSAA